MNAQDRQDLRTIISLMSDLCISSKHLQQMGLSTNVLCRLEEKSLIFKLCSGFLYQSLYSNQSGVPNLRWQRLFFFCVCVCFTQLYGQKRCVTVIHFGIVQNSNPAESNLILRPTFRLENCIQNAHYSCSCRSVILS